MEQINDSANWRLEDPLPGEALATILPVSRRARALMARTSQASPLRESFLQVAGATSIMSGLDYHRD